MARMTFSGCQEMMDELFRESERLNRKAPEMLEAGSAIMTRAWKETIVARKHVKTGDMRDSVASDGRIHRKDDGYTVNVYPRGKDRNGKRNMEKAAILHYGTSKIKGDNFVDAAEDLGRAPAEEAMARVWESD